MNQKLKLDPKMRSKSVFNTFKLGLLSMVICLGIQFTFANSNTFLTKVTLGDEIQSRVSGTVTDADGVPLPGASVVEKGTSNGTQTDFDGNYSIEVASGATLVFSYVGFKTVESVFSLESRIDISLEEDASRLDEVIVTGYGTQTRGEITGAVASLEVEDAVKLPVANAAELLQGRVTGVTVTNTGTPGDAPKINVRGFGTSNNTDPLYIIDGVQTDDNNALNNINPADIKALTVLKDAAAAIYGARASKWCYYSYYKWWKL